MVSRAAKDFLRNTLRSTDYHNRLIEEEEMWRQWEVEKGLTMMVTDDFLRRRMRMDHYPGPSTDRLNGSSYIQKNDQHRSEHKKRNSHNYWSRKLMDVEDKDPERWGHSGYRELYPEEFKRLPSQESSSEDEHKESRRDETKKRIEKRHKKRKRHKHEKRKSKKEANHHTDSETEELRRDIRNIQRQKRGLPLIRKPRNDSSSDSDVRIIGISGPRPPMKKPKVG